MGSQAVSSAPVDTLALIRAARRAAAHPTAQPTRTRYDWTPASYLAAVSSAESGNMGGLGAFIRWAMTDDKVESALAQRIDVMLAKESVFDPPINIPEDWYETFPFDVQQLVLTLGVLAGFCWVRFKPQFESATLAFQIEVWWPDHFDYRAHEDRWYVRTMDGYAPVFDGCDGWKLFTPFGAKEPWQRGKWKSIAVPLLLKHFALDDRARNSEVGALLVGKLKDADDEARQLYLQDLTHLAKETRIVLPNDGDLQLLDRTASGQASVQKETIDWSDRAITLALLSQVVTTEGAAGFSSGQPQLVVLNAILKTQEKSFAQFVAVKLLSPWLELLHSEVLDAWSVVHPTFNRVVYQRWYVEVDADAETEAKKFDDALQGFLKALKGIKDAGLILTQQKVDELAKRYDVPSFEVPSTPTARLTLAPTDVARVVRVDEARASEGLLPLGDERGKLTIGEIAANPEAAAAPPAPAPGVAAPALPGQPVQQSVDTSDADIAALCEMMTHPGTTPAGIPLPPVPRCEHGSPNACRKCGIIRKRGLEFQYDEAGNPLLNEKEEPIVKWVVAWKPLPKDAQ